MDLKKIKFKIITDPSLPRDEVRVGMLPAESFVECQCCGERHLRRELLLKGQKEISCPTVTVENS